MRKLSDLIRVLLCIICLLPPTLLMGATLPAVARWVESTPQGISWLGFFRPRPERVRAGKTVIVRVTSGG